MKDYKSQILSKITDKPCCNYAFVGSLLFSSGEMLEDEDSILVNGTNEVLEKLSKILNKIYPDVVLCSWD